MSAERLVGVFAREADFLVVGVNSDHSTKKLKGPDRPVMDEQSRALMLASLLMVDAVIIFEEDTPLELIKLVKPDVLVKGEQDFSAAEAEFEAQQARVATIERTVDTAPPPPPRVHRPGRSPILVFLLGIVAGILTTLFLGLMRARGMLVL